MFQCLKPFYVPISIYSYVFVTKCIVSGPIHTGATECLRPHIPDIVEFVADVHTLSKVKSNVRGTNMSLNQVILRALHILI